MALDTRLRRGSAVHVGMPWRSFIPRPDNTITAEDRYALAGQYSGLIATPPTQIEQVPNISAPFDTGTYEYNLSAFFEGATTYSIDPAVEVGWNFDTDTGVLTIDTDDADTFGPYTLTASNASGDTDSNLFTVKVSAATVRTYPGLTVEPFFTIRL